MSTDQPLDTEPPAGAGVDELASVLGAAITDLEEYQAFQDARSGVSNSEAATEALAEFREIREEFLLARQTGDATETDLQRLQAARDDLEAVPVMAEFLAAQSALEERLAALNEAISEPLAVDFGERAGGCCQE